MREAIILAGGFGTRLRATVPDLPKSMAPVAGRPFLEILLEFLARNNFSRVIISVGFLADKIINHFGKRFFDLEIVYVIEKEPLGTGGAVKLAMENCLRDHVFIFNGDTYVNLEIGAVEKLWNDNRFPIIVGREVEDVSRYGCLATAKRKVIGFAEKGGHGHGLINVGCYVFKPDQLKNFPAARSFSLETDYLAGAVKKKLFDLFITTGDFIDIGIPEDYFRAQDKFALKKSD